MQLKKNPCILRNIESLCIHYPVSSKGNILQSFTLSQSGNWHQAALNVFNNYSEGIYTRSLIHMVIQNEKPTRMCKPLTFQLREYASLGMDQGIPTGSVRQRCLYCASRDSLPLSYPPATHTNPQLQPSSITDFSSQLCLWICYSLCLGWPSPSSRPLFLASYSVIVWRSPYPTWKSSL